MSHRAESPSRLRGPAEGGERGPALDEEQRPQAVLSERLENISVLAKHAAHNPHLVGPYAQFLWTANEAARLATPAQKSLIRQLASRNLKPEQYTPEIEKIMGWDT